MSVLPHEVKALLELFCLQPVTFGSRQKSSSSSFASWGKIKKRMILHWRIRTGSDWWTSKILQIRTGSHSILSD